MNKLLTTLLATAATAGNVILAAPAFAADAPQPTVKAGEVSSQIVTPENQAAMLKGIIAKMKSDARAKAEKPPEAKK